MSARHLNHHGALLTLRGEIIETHKQVKAHPLTQDHVPTYTTLLTQWDGIFNQELALRDGIAAAKAQMFWVDVTLNGLAGRVSKEILTLTADNRTHLLYIAYFGNKTLGGFRRPILGTQLAGMRLWIPQLAESGVPALVALGAEVDAAVKEADTAATTSASLQQQLTFFREAGDRRKFFDHVNAVRKQTHGELSKLPYQHATLPSDFADLFFLHASGKEESTIESVQESIADLSKQLTEQQALLQELEAAAEVEAQKAAELEAKKAQAAELEKEAAEAEAMAKAKRAKIAELGM